MANRHIANKLDPSVFVEKLEKVAKLEEVVTKASGQYEKFLSFSGSLTKKLRAQVTPQVQKAGKDFHTADKEYVTAAKDLLAYTAQNGTTLRIITDYINESFGNRKYPYLVHIAAKEFEQLSEKPALVTLYWIKTAGLIASGTKAQKQSIKKCTLASTVKKDAVYTVYQELEIWKAPNNDCQLVAYGQGHYLYEVAKGVSLPLIGQFFYDKLLSHLEQLAKKTNSEIVLHGPNNT